MPPLDFEITEQMKPKLGYRICCSFVPFKVIIQTDLYTLVQNLSAILLYICVYTKTNAYIYWCMYFCIMCSVDCLPEYILGISVCECVCDLEWVKVTESILTVQRYLPLKAIFSKESRLKMLSNSTRFCLFLVSMATRASITSLPDLAGCWQTPWWPESSWWGPCQGQPMRS